MTGAIHGTGNGKFSDEISDNTMIMKNIFIFAMLLLCTINCVGQQNTNDKQIKNNKKMVYRTFNIEEYKSITQKNEYGKRYVVSKSGMIIVKDEEFMNNKFIGFREDCSYPNDPYTYVFIYNTEGSLIKSWTTFYNIPVGKETEYDGLGFKTKETDKDALYRFGIKALVDKMQKEYKVDLLDMKSIYQVSRYYVKDMNQSFYEVFVYQPNTLVQADAYLIDGTSGETLLKSVRSVRLEFGAPHEETMLEEYEHKLAEKAGHSK